MTMTDERRKELLARYAAAAHAMQSGVAMMMNKDPKDTEPKHLRVGVNSAMSDQMGLAKLLMAKGVFTEEEYFVAVAEAMEEEANRYVEEVNEAYGGRGRMKLG